MVKICYVGLFKVNELQSTVLPPSTPPPSTKNFTKLNTLDLSLVVTVLYQKDQILQKLSQEEMFCENSCRSCNDDCRKWACSSDADRTLENAMDKYWKVNEGGQCHFTRKKTLFFKSKVLDRMRKDPYA